MKKCFTLIIFLVLPHAISAQIPVFRWARAFTAHNKDNPSVYSNGRSVAVDNQGNVYSAGLFYYTTDFDPGPGVFALTAVNWTNSAIYVSKLSAAGDLLWAIQIPTDVEFGNIELRVDHENNVYIASQLRLPADFDPGPGETVLSPIGGVDAFVAKYDPDGHLVWAKQFGGPGDVVSQSDVLDLDNGDNVILCGSFNSTVDFDPGPAEYNITSTAGTQSFMVRLNSAGDFIWAKQFGNSSTYPGGAHIGDVKCDDQDNVYVTGDFSGRCDFDPGPGKLLLQGGSLNNPYVAKLNSKGDLLWAKSVESTTNDPYQYTETRGIDVDAHHNVYVIGDFYGSFDFDPGSKTHVISSTNTDWYILQLSDQGDFGWVDVFGGDQNDVAADVAISSDGSVYGCGTVGHTADMDPGPGKYDITSINLYGSSALVRIGSNGAFVSAATFDQTSVDSYGDCLTRRMVIDDRRNIYITGNLSGVIDFDPGQNVYPLASGGTEAPFVLKLAKCPDVTVSTLDISSCGSYTLNGEVFDSTGTYLQTIPNSSGCDSIITLNLKINKRDTELTRTICAGESYFAGGARQTAPGTYYDTLATSLGCDSIITTHLTVNPKPNPSLGPDRNLCAGTEYTLNPGIFPQYQWQDKTVSNTLTVDAPGLYWVKVTNEFNCSAADSMTVESVLPRPGGFLKKTDSLCTFQELTISALGTFSQYLWSTGDVGSQITVNKPGAYWLKVTDQNGCTATNSISVYAKDCMDGVFLPSAFTPNGDGRNDVFKASVFGKVIFFRLQVYNREGELVFQTTDPSRGWNGSYKGRRYSTAGFVWQCSYQLQGRQPESHKGTVTLIR
jgi:gliding motility-associated-like protein